MAKLAIWLITLAGVTVPLLLSLACLSFVSRYSLPTRYTQPTELGGDPILHQSYFFVEILGQRFGINPSSYPPLIMLAGVLFIIVGLFLMLHVNTGISWSDVQASENDI